MDIYKILEETEELLYKHKVEVNKKIAEQQAQIFKQTVVPRRIAVQLPTQKKEEKKEKEEPEEIEVSEYKNKKLQYSFIFPALSIDQSSQCDLSKASKILAKEILKFLHEHEEKSIKIALLDDSENPCKPLLTKYLATLFKQNNLTQDDRFVILSEKETKNLSEIFLNYRFVACPITWRYKANHVVTRKLFREYKPVHSLLQKQIKDVYQTATCGKNYALALKDELFESSQVFFFVNPPNFNNPQKPNCLGGNYEIGLPLLESCYSSMFLDFAKLCKLKEDQ